MKTRTISPALLVPIVLVLGAFGWFGYSYYAAGEAVSAERRKLLEHVEIELNKEVVDDSELSRLMSRIRGLEDHATAPDLLAAQARIELFRDRPERAVELFASVASEPGAAPADQGLAARILLRRHEAGLPNRGDAVLMLEQALAFADLAHAHSNDPEDLMRCWLAAMRLADKERIDEFAERIVAEHPESTAARFVRFWREFSLTSSLDDLELVRRDFEVPPAELDAMLALLMLTGNDLDGAVSLVESLLARFAGVVEVRVTAALVFHACVEGSPEGSPQRAQWAARRNAQLDWLLEQARPDDDRRPRWAATRQQN